jgi:tRNA 2-thiouridine synthesizing protein A
MKNSEITTSIDTSGKCCPMPIVDTNKAIKRMDIGQVLEIISTDPGTQNDIPSWCERTGNELIEVDSGEGEYRYFIRKQQNA